MGTRVLPLAALAVACAVAAGCKRAPAAHADDYIAAFRDRPERMAPLRVEVAADRVDALAAAWGPPAELRLRGEPARVWLAPAARMRAVLTSDGQLAIEPYLPAATIVAPRGQPLGIETARELVDATPADLEAAYPGHVHRVTAGRVWMTWPPDEYGGDVTVELRLRDHAVVCIQYALHHGADPAIAADRLALLEARYGTSTPLPDGRHQLSASPRVIARDTGEAWSVEVCKPDAS